MSSEPREQAHALLDLVQREAAALGAALVVAADDLQAAVERVLLHLDDRHRDAGIGEVHRDAAAHGAGADDADLLDRDRRRVVRHVGDLVRPGARRRRRSAAPPTAGRSSAP